MLHHVDERTASGPAIFAGHACFVQGGYEHCRKLLVSEFILIFGTHRFQQADGGVLIGQDTLGDLLNHTASGWRSQIHGHG